MEFNDLINSIFTLIGIATVFAFAITGIKSAYQEIQKEKRESQTVDQHFDTAIRE